MPPIADISSATAPPRPPTTLCSSTLTTRSAPTAPSNADRSKGLMVDWLTTRQGTPRATSSRPAASASAATVPVATSTTRGASTSRRTSAQPMPAQTPPGWRPPVSGSLIRT